jgi:hypothetical protein
MAKLEGTAGTVGKVAALASNFMKTRSLPDLFRGMAKLEGTAGTAGKVATLAANFAKTRSLKNLVRGVDEVGLLAKAGALGKLAKLAGNFGRSRTLGEFVTNASPLLKATAKMAAPMVANSIAGPFAGIAASLLNKMLREAEAEAEMYAQEGEFEQEIGSTEPLGEAEAEILGHEMTYHELLAEMIAEAAEQEQNETEAEAMAGAAALTVISPADRRALRRVLPHLIRGTAVLTRVLRARPTTRPAVRAVPTIMRRTVRALKQEAAEGVPITRRETARVAAREIRRVLGSPVACAAAMANNVRATRALREAA